MKPFVDFECQWGKGNIVDLIRVGFIGSEYKGVYIYLLGFGISISLI